MTLLGTLFEKCTPIFYTLDLTRKSNFVIDFKIDYPFLVSQADFGMKKGTLVEYSSSSNFGFTQPLSISRI